MARIFASPLARRLAKEKNIDLSAVKGSGPHGRIVRLDIDSAKPSAATSSAPSTTAAARAPDSLVPAFELRPNNNVRKVIAKRLSQSKQTVPHFYLTVECEIDNLLAFRARVNSSLEKEGVKVSVNDIVIKASAMALMAVPEANAEWTEEAIKVYKSADISVAVAIDGGLITPIVRDAQTKSLRQISAEMKDLAAKARSNKLAPHEFQGGTFSISNLGMFGIDEFAAIVNPPQGAILAVGQGKESVVVKKGQMVVANVMKLTLSVDHRVVDGAVGARYLQVLKSYIEDPAMMIA